MKKHIEDRLSAANAARKAAPARVDAKHDLGDGWTARLMAGGALTLEKDGQELLIGRASVDRLKAILAGGEESEA